MSHRLALQSVGITPAAAKDEADAMAAATSDEIDAPTKVPLSLDFVDEWNYAYDQSEVPPRSRKKVMPRLQHLFNH